MIYNLLTPFAEDFFLFNLARYHTFRAGAACMTALLICLVFGSTIIRWLRSFQRGGQPIRDDGPERHLIEKKGTPTMGGVMILLALVVSTLLWADLRSGMVWAVLMITVGYGALGFADDWLKVTKRNTKGVSGRAKLVVQAGLGLVAALWITALMPGPLGDRLALPFFKEVLVPFGLLFPLHRHAGDDGRLQRGEPDRRARRAGHRAGDDRGGGLRADRLPRRQPRLRRLPATALCAGHRRTRRASPRR